MQGYNKSGIPIPAGRRSVEHSAISESYFFASGISLAVPLFPLVIKSNYILDLYAPLTGDRISMVSILFSVGYYPIDGGGAGFSTSRKTGKKSPFAERRSPHPWMKKFALGMVSSKDY